MRVGIIAPMTGGSADRGVQFRNCIQLYQSRHGGTVAGRKVEMLYRDTGGANPSLAKKRAEELIVNDKVQVLGGFFVSPNAFAVSPVLTQAKVPGSAWCRSRRPPARRSGARRDLPRPGHAHRRAGRSAPRGA